MTQTTAAQVEAVYNRALALTAWDQQVLADLYALVAEPMQTMYQRTLAPYQPGVVTDNIYRLKPPGWLRNGQELGPDSTGKLQGCVAGFQYWEFYQPGGYYGLKTEMWGGKVMATLALAMLLALAKLWHDLLVAAGR